MKLIDKDALVAEIERLYLSKTIYSTYLYQVPDPDDETAVEYTRTDAFIEKACEYLESNVKIILCGDKTDTDKFIDEFKRYMEKELWNNTSKKPL